MDWIHKHLFNWTYSFTFTVLSPPCMCVSSGWFSMASWLDSPICTRISWNSLNTWPKPSPCPTSLMSPCQQIWLSSWAPLMRCYWRNGKRLALLPKISRWRSNLKQLQLKMWTRDKRGGLKKTWGFLWKEVHYLLLTFFFISSLPLFIS